MHLPAHAPTRTCLPLAAKGVTASYFQRRTEDEKLDGLAEQTSIHILAKPKGGRFSLFRSCLDGMTTMTGGELCAASGSLGLESQS